MSHFTAVVVLKHPDDLAETLAPYCEGLDVDPYRSVLGKVAESAAKARNWYATDPAHAPAGFPNVSAEALALHYHSDEGANVRIDGDEVVYDSTYNPQSKWDWYSVGGRWRGFFQVRSGVAAALGDTSWVHRGDETDYTGRADIVQVKDVDWDTMQVRARAEAVELYDRYEAAVGDAPEPRAWDEIRREVLAADGIPDDWDAYRAQHQDNGEGWRLVWDQAMSEARQQYHSQPWCERLGKAGIWADGPEDYFVGAGGREAFISDRIARVGVPLALVKDGQWAARGEMGWFGVMRSESDSSQWNAFVRDVYAGLDPDAWLVAVDCHI